MRFDRKKLLIVLTERMFAVAIPFAFWGEGAATVSRDIDDIANPRGAIGGTRMPRLKMPRIRLTVGMLRVLFLLFVLFGLAGMVSFQPLFAAIEAALALVEMDISAYAEAPWAPTIVPAFLILVYAGVYPLRDESVPPMAFGNSVYFLGFVFTLLALVTTLWLVGNAVGDEGNDNRELVSTTIAKSGIALATTILGLVLRVMLVQFAPEDPSPAEREEAALLQALRTLTTEVDKAKTDFVAAVATFVSEIGASQGRMSTAADAFSDSLQQIAPPPQVVTDTVRKTFADLENASARLAVKLNDTQNAAIRLADTWSRLDERSEPARAAGVELEKIAQKIAEAAESVGKAARRQRDTLDATAQNFVRVGETHELAVERLRKTLDDLERRAGELTLTLEGRLADGSNAAAPPAANKAGDGAALPDQATS